MRDAVSEEGRILSIFEKEGVIKLKPGIDKVTARISDIVENPKKSEVHAERGSVPAAADVQQRRRRRGGD